MIKDHTPDVWGKSVPMLIDETTRIIDAILAAGKLMDEAPFPTKGRVLYDPETGEVIKILGKNKYPVTQPERNKP